MSEIRTSVWLIGGRLAIAPQVAVQADVEISNGYIRNVIVGTSFDMKASTLTSTVNVEGYLLLPGLINAHDHLEFNLFPRLGNGPYANSEEWARDVYRPDHSPVREHLSVAKDVRLWWGGLKNLVSGVTTVCHHNPWDPLFDAGFPVRVVRRYGWAHSIVFDNNIPGSFAATGPEVPFVIHLGEGTDQRSQEEIFALEDMGALDQRTVLVHGVALTPAGHDLWQQRGAALVWCPTSNQFTLGTTLDPRSITHSERIALGSDSALTGRGTLLEELHAARVAGVPAVSIYRMVTESAAAILRLDQGEGSVRRGSAANLIAIPFEGETPAEALAKLNPEHIEMVVVSGRLNLASLEMAARWPLEQTEGLEWISIEGVERSVRAPVSWLVAETSKHLPDGIRLAGRRVSA